MDIPQIDNIDPNTINNLNDAVSICLALMFAITVIWVTIVIYARLPQEDNEVSLITLFVDNYGLLTNRIIFTIVIVLGAFAAYFNYFT